MSSPADEGETPNKKVPGWRQPWERWRILMLTGSLVLLGLAFSRLGGRDRLPEWLTVAIYAVGYGILAYGFFLAMRARKGVAPERRQEKKKVSPRDPG